MEADRWESPHGGMPRVLPEAARTADESLSPPSADGADRRRPHPSFPSLLLASLPFFSSKAKGKEDWVE